MNFEMMRRPGAILPLVMALAALTLVLGHAAVYGIVHEIDEGTAAHIFQLLMVLQLPADAFLIVEWLPSEPRQTLQILALQAFIVFAAFAGVFFLT